MNKARKPPAAWLALHGGDLLNTKIAFHRIDYYLGVMAEQGYTIETEETRTGYRLHCLKSPLDRPKRPKLTLVNG